MFVCIDTKTGKHTEGFQTLDDAQEALVLLQKKARLNGKICQMTIIEVDELPSEDEFLIY